MSVTMKNDKQAKECNFDISFDLSDFIEDPINIEKKIVDKSEEIQHKPYIGSGSNDDEKNIIQADESNGNVHDHETSEVSLNISFDYSDLEPISTEKESFLTQDSSSMSLGISYLVELETFSKIILINFL